MGLTLGLGIASGLGSPNASARAVAPSPLPTPSAAANTYVHYYLWWTTQHWHDKLGLAYPYNAHPLPPPGSTDPTGCNPTVRYAGATIVDLPSEGLYSEDLASTYDRHIAAAAAAGIRGFVVSWIGDGTSSQTAPASSLSAHLALLVRRVHAYNSSHAKRFGLALGMSVYTDYLRLPAATIADLNYFIKHYGTDSAFHNAYSSKPLVMLLASRKLSPGTLGSISTAVRGKLLLLGDETASTWAQDVSWLDGTSYYWSSEHPSPYDAAAIASLADKVHAAGKLWFSPFSAGYDKQLVSGTCVPRNGLQTLDGIWAQNGASHPDGWMGISWNELVENTYLEPSLTYGTTYLDELRRLIAAG